MFFFIVLTQTTWQFRYKKYYFFRCFKSIYHTVVHRRGPRLWLAYIQSNTSMFRILLVFITRVYAVINQTFLPSLTNPQSRQINSRELLHEFLREFPKDAEKHVYLQWKICSRRFASVNCYFFPFRFCKKHQLLEVELPKQIQMKNTQKAVGLLLMISRGL